MPLAGRSSSGDMGSSPLENPWFIVLWEDWECESDVRQVESSHDGSTGLLRAPGVAVPLVDRESIHCLKSGWRAGTEQAIMPMFCSKLEGIILEKNDQIFASRVNDAEEHEADFVTLEGSWRVDDLRAPYDNIHAIIYFSVSMVVHSWLQKCQSTCKVAFRQITQINDFNDAADWRPDDAGWAERAIRLMMGVTDSIPKPMIPHRASLSRRLTWSFRRMMMGKPAQAKSVTIDQATAVQKENSMDDVYTFSILTSLCIADAQYLGVREAFPVNPNIPSSTNRKTTKDDCEARRQAQNQNDSHQKVNGQAQGPARPVSHDTQQEETCRNLDEGRPWNV